MLFRSRRALALLGFAVAAPHVAARKSAAQSATGVRVVVNRGAENQTLLALLEQQGYAAAMGVAQALVTVAAPAATLEALVEDRADVCVVSGFNGLLPAIEKGAAVKVVGAAQQTAALAVYASRPDIKRVADLAGRTVGIGPDLGLLHVTAIALLRAKGVDPASVKFVNVGANAEVYRDVKAGKIDAGVSDVSNMADADKSRLVTLPEDRKSTRLNSSHMSESRMPSSA